MARSMRRARALKAVLSLCRSGWKHVLCIYGIYINRALSDIGQPRIGFWAEKIAHSKIGNPYQLARMFRKYDTEQGRHTSTVLLPEFVQVMMDGNLEVPRGLCPDPKLSRGCIGKVRGSSHAHVLTHVHMLRDSDTQWLAPSAHTDARPYYPRAVSPHCFLSCSSVLRREASQY